MTEIGRLVLAVGVLLVLAGAALMILGRLHLPGDLVLRRGGFTLTRPWRRASSCPSS